MNFSIEQVLPHKDPMILIDELLSFEENAAKCCLHITPKSPFYDESMVGVPSYVGIEYMAQTIAAYANANAIAAGKKVEIGFLVSTRKYKAEMPVFSNNCHLEVTVEKLYKDESGLSAFDCKINEMGKEVASARINVYQPENPEAFLAQMN